MKENEGVSGKLKKEIHWESAYPFVFPLLLTVSIRMRSTKYMMYSRKTRYRHDITPNHLLRILVIMVLAVSSSSGVFFYLFEIDFINYLPTRSLCPFHAITGLACPGCGMTRAMISLGQLKIGAAIDYNLFSLPLFIFMIFYVWPGKFPSFLQQPVSSIFMLLLVIIVWLMRLSGIQAI